MVSEDYSDLRPIYESRYGYSRVFTAQNRGKKVIVKALKESCKSNPKCIASLQAEYDTTSILDHKYLRKALDFTKIEGLGDCIIFEYIEGKSLAEHVRVGTLSEKQVKNVLVDVCDGLSYLHRNQVVHGNLTPENIMVAADSNRAKLIDIGVPVTDPGADRELLIKEMELVAPEIIKGEEFDVRADIYSLGKIMEFIGERNISKQFLTVATHCTQFSKEQRYDSILEVRSGITKGHPVVKTVVLLLLFALLGVLAFILVPKIKSNVMMERAARKEVDFNHAIGDIQSETQALCEKYRLTSLSEKVSPNWSADSLRLVQTLMPFFGTEDYKARGLKALDEQRTLIENSRQNDFNTLLLSEFKNANDSLAVALKAVLVEPTDEQLFMEAQKWHGQMK